eukprot:m51a1_g5601 hypothetical protein (424) ;mRNA; f:695570-697167
MQRSVVLAFLLLGAALADVCGRPGDETDMNPVPTPCPSETHKDWSADACRGARWPHADKEIDGNWWPSRVTHYGSTTNGACGFGSWANCKSSSEAGCEGIPEEIFKNPMQGYYTAPQGSYYSQGLPRTYTSCGECFQIRCVDSKWCPSAGEVTVRVADACPCSNNEKWCCGNFSLCQELGNDNFNAASHCPRNSPNWWDQERSVHLDLNDAAMARLSGGMPGIANTIARRVSCPATGNIWLTTGTQDVHLEEDYTFPPNKTKCLWWLSLVAVNVAGSGSISGLEVEATRWSRNPPAPSRGWIKMGLDSCTELTRPQEQYGAFKIGYELDVKGSGMNRLYFPLRFRLRNRYGQVAITRTIETADDWLKLRQDKGTYKMWFNTGIQFPPIPRNENGTVVNNGTVIVYPPGVKPQPADLDAAMASN